MFQTRLFFKNDHASFDNNVLRHLISEHFYSIKDEDFIRRDEDDLFQEAFQKFKKEGAAIAEEPEKIIRKGRNGESDMLDFNYRMSGDHNVFLLHMSGMRSPLPSHVVNGEILTLSYQAIGDPKAIKAKHLSEMEGFRQNAARANEAVSGFNAMATTEIKQAIKEGKQKAEERRKFLDDLK